LIEVSSNRYGLEHTKGDKSKNIQMQIDPEQNPVNSLPRFSITRDPTDGPTCARSP